jgi:hypothetical protein
MKAGITGGGVPGAQGVADDMGKELPFIKPRWRGIEFPAIHLLLDEVNRA